MMQKMLAERFKVTVHRDQKTMVVYGSAVGKKGINIQGGAAGHSNSDSNNIHYTGRSFWMEGFAAFLSGKTFYDKTAGDL